MLMYRRVEGYYERKRYRKLLQDKVDQVLPNAHRDPCLGNGNRVCQQKYLFLLQSIQNRIEHVSSYLGDMT